MVINDEFVLHKSYVTCIIVISYYSLN